MSAKFITDLPTDEEINAILKDLSRTLTSSDALSFQVLHDALIVLQTEDVLLSKTIDEETIYAYGADWSYKNHLNAKSWPFEAAIGITQFLTNNTGIEHLMSPNSLTRPTKYVIYKRV